MSTFWNQRRVLVTGGTGFLGYHLCKLLCDQGARVRSFALPVSHDHVIHSLPIDLREGDIRDSDAVQRTISGCDFVFHSAGNVAVWGPGLAVMHDIHVNGTRNVLMAAGKDIPVVHTSSITAVGATHHGDVLNEDAPFRLQNLKVHYVHAKRNAEQLALEHNAIVLNPGYLIGPDDYESSVMGKFCDRVWKGKMALAAPGGYNLVDVRDVAQGHLLAAECGQPGRRYILGGTNLDLQTFMQLLVHVADMSPRAMPRLPMAALWFAAGCAELRALKTKREPYPSFQHVRLNRYRWFVSSDRAKNELGYQPRSIEKSIRDTWAWYSERKSIQLRGMTKWWMRPKQAA